MAGTNGARSEKPHQGRQVIAGRIHRTYHEVVETHECSSSNYVHEAPESANGGEKIRLSSGDKKSPIFKQSIKAKANKRNPNS